MKIDTKKSEQQVIDLSDKKLEKYWDDVHRYFVNGLPAKDEYGHHAEIRFRCRDLQKDMVYGIMAKLPPNFFNSLSDCYRSIFAVGCRTLIEYMKKEHKNTELDEIRIILEGLNRIAKRDRVLDFQKELRKLEQSIMDKETYTDDAKKFFDLAYKKLKNLDL